MQMGKLSLSDANDLLEKGVLTQKTYDKMADDGHIATGRRKRTPVEYTTQEGTIVTLEIYWKGLNKKTPSLEMNKLKDDLYSMALSRTKPTEENPKTSKGQAK